MIADILASDPQGKSVLLVEVKSRPLDAEFVRQYFQRMSEADPFIPFLMVLDPQKIYLRKYLSNGLGGDALTLSTPEILRHYEPEFGSVRIFESYLIALVEAWLRDLAFRWRGEDPPGLAELTQFGLMHFLAGGTARQEVPIGVDAVH